MAASNMMMDITTPTTTIEETAAAATSLITIENEPRRTGRAIRRLYNINNPFSSFNNNNEHRNFIPYTTSSSSSSFSFNCRKDGLLTDVWEYIHNYPSKEKSIVISENEKWLNARFYMSCITINEEKNGLKIDEIHEKWFGSFKMLESMHDYIQWLFPIQEKGLNHKANTLHKCEIDFFRKCPLIQERMIRSYRLMLNFYGMVLADPATGRVERSKDGIDRYKSWAGSKHDHNYQRISRICKSLGEIGYDHYHLELCKHIVREQHRGLLLNTKDSAEDYWFVLFRDPIKRAHLQEYIDQFPPVAVQANSMWFQSHKIWADKLVDYEIRSRGSSGPPFLL